MIEFLESVLGQAEEAEEQEDVDESAVVAKEVSTIGGEEHLLLHPREKNVVEYHADGEWITGRPMEARP